MSGRALCPSEWESEAAYEADCRQGSLWRKAKEAVYAMAMEVKYSKDEILTIYLNRAFSWAQVRAGLKRPASAISVSLQPR